MKLEDFHKLVERAAALTGGKTKIPISAVQAFIEACHCFVTIIKNPAIIWHDGLRVITRRGRQGMSINLPHSFCQEHGIDPAAFVVQFGEYHGPSTSGPTLMMQFERKAGK